MNYWDNSFDRNFDAALDEMIKAQNTPLTEHDIDIMYQEHLQKANISNPMKLHGAI